LDERQRAIRDRIIQVLRVNAQWLPSAWGVISLPMEWIEGKLCFEIGDQAVSCEFQQFALLLLQNPGLCPPYCCPLSGQCGKDLAADQEGDISLTNQLRTCQLTGKRLHDFKLVTCVNSGQRLCRSLAVASATTSDWLSPKHASLCRQCGLVVPRRAQRLGRCVACRSLRDIRELTAAEQVAGQWLLSSVAGELGTSFEELRQVRAYHNHRLTWLMFEWKRRYHLVVFDGAGPRLTPCGWLEVRTCQQISCRSCRNRLASNSRENRVLTHSG
jgi:hypothetical protein